MNDAEKFEFTSNEKSILKKLIRVDRQYAIVMVLEMFLAGFDTVIISAQNLLYQLAINPEKQAKLNEEIFGLLPKIDSPINTESLNNAPYFRACYKESLRMKPPTNTRSAGQNIVIKGYQIPKMVSTRFIRRTRWIEN